MNLMRSIFIACLVLAVPAVGMTQSSAENVARQVTTLKNALDAFRSYISGEIIRVDGNISRIDAELAALKKCQASGMFYAPKDAGADNNGCIEGGSGPGDQCYVAGQGYYEIGEVINDGSSRCTASCSGPGGPYGCGRHTGHYQKVKTTCVASDRGPVAQSETINLGGHCSIFCGGCR